MRYWRSGVLGGVAIVLTACGGMRQARPLPRATEACVPPARWVVPASGGERPTTEVIDRAARGRVVLLGEHHDRADDHRWQLQTVAALAARRAQVVLGFEMFPRRVQPVLDRWVAGELDAPGLLRETGWARVWGFPPDLYLPLFEFARLNRVPMRALNVERTLVARVGREGWDAIPATEREGITDPAPPSAAYETALAGVLAAHGAHGGAKDESTRRRFVEAQLTWDRALAEGLADAARRWPTALVIGILGSGHLEHGHGVPHQLAALGVRDVTVLLPWGASRPCAALAPDLADAVFGIPPSPDTPRSPRRLGVALAADPRGARVTGVTAGSIAAAAGLRSGDVIVEAAGAPVTGPDDLRAVVDLQAPGTWLPLRVWRAGRVRQVVARFGRPA